MVLVDEKMKEGFVFIVLDIELGEGDLYLCYYNTLLLLCHFVSMW